MNIKKHIEKLPVIALQDSVFWLVHNSNVEDILKIKPIKDYYIKHGLPKDLQVQINPVTSDTYFWYTDVTGVRRFGQYLSKEDMFLENGTGDFTHRMFVIKYERVNGKK